MKDNLHTTHSNCKSVFIIYSKTNEYKLTGSKIGLTKQRVFQLVKKAKRIYEYENLIDSDLKELLHKINSVKVFLLCMNNNILSIGDFKNIDWNNIVGVGVKTIEKIIKGME